MDMFFNRLLMFLRKKQPNKIKVIEKNYKIFIINENNIQRMYKPPIIIVVTVSSGGSYVMIKH